MWWYVGTKDSSYSGNHASDWELELRKDQKDVCEMAGNRTTVFVETTKYDHREEPRLSTNVHYYGRGDTMIEIGSAMATEMLNIMFRKEEFGEIENEIGP